MNTEDRSLHNLQSRKWDVDIYGAKFSVFDIETSRTPKFVHDHLAGHDLLAHLVDPKVIVDVGANVGMITFLAAKRFPKAKIYAIEPHHWNVRHLISGVIENKLTNVTVLPVGVGLGASLTDLNLEIGNSGSSGAYPNGFRMFPEDWPKLPSTCLTVSLNHVVSAIIKRDGMIDFLKVDIEGMEFDVMQGFTLWDCINSLDIELHPFNVPRSVEEAKALTEKFSEFLKRKMNGRPTFIEGPEFEKEMWSGAVSGN